MMKIEIKKNTKAFNEFHVKMILTEGALLTIHNALTIHAQTSPIAQDLIAFLDNAATKTELKF